MSKNIANRDFEEEQSILSAVKKGETGRFREIEKSYHKKILFYLWHLLGSKEEAEDILQNVFMKVYASIGSFDNRKHFSSWIYRIAHNEAMNYLKRRNRFRSISWEDIASVKDRAEASDHEDSPEERWVRAENRNAVRNALKKLPPKYREALFLRYYSDHSYDKIAEIIGKPRNTVGTLISRAKKRLLKALGEER